MGSSEDSEDQVYYFGWVTPSRTEQDSDKFDLGIRSEPLPNEIVEEFHEVVGAFPKIRPTCIDFLTLRAEHKALSQLHSELLPIFGTPNFVLFDVGTRNIESHVLAERRLSAFLNAASAFRDRMLGRVSSDAFALSTIKAKLSQLYDASFGYRLCYNLRNFAQHHEHPLHIIPVNAARNSSDEMVFEIDLELDRDRLTGAESKFQSKVKSELRAMGPKIPLIPNCDEYFRCLWELFSAYLSLNGPGIEKLAGYETVVRASIPEMAPDATPLLFHGKPEQTDGEFTTKVTSFSFDELDFLRGLIVEMTSEPDSVVTE